MKTTHSAVRLLDLDALAEPASPAPPSAPALPATSTPPGGPALSRVPADLPRRVGLALAAVVALLALGNVVAIVAHHGLGTGRIVVLQLKDEQTLGTWVANLLLASCGALAAANAVLAHGRERRWVRNWWLLAAVFLLMSLDEVVALHDRAMEPLRQVLGTTGVLYYAWIIPAVGLGLVFLLLQVRFLRHLGRPTGLGLVLAGAVFVAGAVGMEMVQGVLATAGRDQGLLDEMTTLVEETVELATVAWAACLLLGHLLRGTVDGRGAAG